MPLLVLGSPCREFEAWVRKNPEVRVRRQVQVRERVEEVLHAKPDERRGKWSHQPFGLALALGFADAYVDGYADPGPIRVVDLDRDIALALVIPSCSSHS